MVDQHGTDPSQVEDDNRKVVGLAVGGFALMSAAAIGTPWAVNHLYNDPNPGPRMDLEQMKERHLSNVNSAQVIAPEIPNANQMPNVVAQGVPEQTQVVQMPDHEA